MNGADQAALAIRLDQALKAAGVRILRARIVRGNVRAWEPVEPVTLVGVLVSHNWRVELAAVETPVIPLRPVS